MHEGGMMDGKKSQQDYHRKACPC